MEKQERDVEEKSQAAKDHPTDQETVTALGLEDLPERNRRAAIKFPRDHAPENKMVALGPGRLQSSWGHPTRHKNVGEVFPRLQVW